MRLIHRGKLTNEFGSTDQNNALTIGFDLIDFSWPAFINSDLGINKQLLPWVVRSVKPSTMSRKNAPRKRGWPKQRALLPETTSPRPIKSPPGHAASEIGNTLLGTPIVVRGLTKDLLIDPLGRFYCHLLPKGIGCRAVQAMSVRAFLMNASRR